MSTGTGATDAQIEDAARRHCDLFDILPEYEQSNWIEFFTISAQRLVPPDHRIVPAAALPAPEVVAAIRAAVEAMQIIVRDDLFAHRRSGLTENLPSVIEALRTWLDAMEGGR